MLLSLSFGFASAVTKHNTSRSFINPGFKATRKLQGGEVPPCPEPTKTESKRQPHPTPFRRDVARYGLVLARATAGQDLPQEPLLDNAAMPRKAKCDTANRCLNKTTTKLVCLNSSQIHSSKTQEFRQMRGKSDLPSNISQQPTLFVLQSRNS